MPSRSLSGLRDLAFRAAAKPDLDPAPVPHARPARVVSIRASILLGFAMTCIFTAALGFYSSEMIRQSASLVVDTFDRSLMSIDYARAAAADFAAMQTAFLRQRLTAGGAGAGGVPQRVVGGPDPAMQALMQAFNEDLDISAQRAQSPRARAAARAVRAAAEGWLQSEAAIDGHSPLAATLTKMDGYSEQVAHRIDLLVNIMAGDGFLFRQQALLSISTNTRLDIAFTLAALVLSAAVTWALNHRISGPVRAASFIARRIAGGDLDVAIPEGRGDELGSLLRSMQSMRESIRNAMEDEVSQRRSAQSRLMDAIESTQEGVVLVDAGGRVVITNAPVAAFFGSITAHLPPSFAISDLLSGMARTTLDPESKQALSQLAAPALADGRGTIDVGLLDGRSLRVSWSSTREGGLIAFFSDITLPRSREAQLKQTNLWFDAALTNMSQGLCVYDSEGRLKICNPRFHDIFGLHMRQIWHGMPFPMVFALLAGLGETGYPDLGQPGTSDMSQSDPEAKNAGEGHGRSFDIAAIEDMIARRAVFSGQHYLKTGRVIAYGHRAISDGGWVLTYEDVTDRHRSAERIAFLARHDSLTGLPNRMLFNECLDKSLQKMETAGSGFVLLLIDLDRFKEVNDTRGHPVGDRMLRAVAERLSACCRQGDTVARLGGDEFAAILSGPNDQASAETRAERVVQAIASPFAIDGQRLEIAASVGIALAPQHGRDGETLLRNVDTALYGVKDAGRNGFRVFTPDMDTARQAQRALEHDLVESLEERQMELFYQPVVSLQTGQVAGFEALLRWHHPIRGLMMPDEFIGLSEDIGFIDRLGAWIIRQACVDAAGWPDGLRVAINVSPIQFRSGCLVSSLQQALAATSLEPTRVELEITERTLLHENEATLSILRELHGIGVTVALDDFGTGFSSLNYLRSFPFDRIKIDRSFVVELGIKDESAAIVDAILGLGRSLRIPVTAEGVETEEQLARLHAAGCDQGQGYLFSRALPVGGVASLRRDWSALMPGSAREKLRKVGGVIRS